MPDLPADWSTLMVVVFALGLRHGIDADHVAAIDAPTRLAARKPALCGALFASGHGLAVLAMVTLLVLVGRPWQPPAWLLPLGNGLSIVALAALGTLNLHRAWQPARPLPATGGGRAAVAAGPVACSGWRLRWMTRIPGAGKPAAGLWLGALFAMSLDTAGLAVVFALNGRDAGGAGHALALAGLFAAGMLLTDGGNGWWLARLLRRHGDAAAPARRWTAGLVGAASLAVAGVGLAGWRWPQAAGAAWGAAWGLPWGPALALGVLALSGLARRRWRHPP